MKLDDEEHSRKYYISSKTLKRKRSEINPEVKIKN